MGANGLRIIAGIARGRTLETLPGLHTRPTSDRVKESLFSMLQMRLRDARVLDLFDIVFVDPPYRLGVYERVLQALFHGGLVAEDGLVVCEHAAQNAILEQPDIYRAVDTRRYGKSALTFIQGVGRAAAKRGLHDEDMHLSGEL